MKKLSGGEVGQWEACPVLQAIFLKLPLIQLFDNTLIHLRHRPP